MKGTCSVQHQYYIGVSIREYALYVIMKTQFSVGLAVSNLIDASKPQYHGILTSQDSVILKTQFSVGLSVSNLIDASKPQYLGILTSQDSVLLLLTILPLHRSQLPSHHSLIPEYPCSDGRLSTRPQQNKFEASQDMRNITFLHKLDAFCPNRSFVGHILLA